MVPINKGQTMAQKNKKNSKRKKSSTNKAIWLGLLGMLSFLILFTIAQIVIGKILQTYRTKQDIQLLDQADAKMRTFDVPKADEVSYKRTCSFRSVKFEDPGPPNCRVVRYEQFFNRSETAAVELAEKYISQMLAQFPNSKAQDNTHEYFTGNFSSLGEYRASVDPLLIDSGELSCYQNYSLRNVSGSGSSNEGESAVPDVDSLQFNVTTSCYKEFPKQVYPERN